MGKSSFPRYGYMIESASQNNFELLEHEDASNTMREILVQGATALSIFRVRGDLVG
jgi:hypothetical protein